MAEADWDNEVEQMQQEEAPPAPFVAEPVEIKLFNRYHIILLLYVIFVFWKVMRMFHGV